MTHKQHQESQDLAVMLAQTWDKMRDLSGWMASEKLDGVRAYWTGSQFVSRSGHSYNPPAWWSADLPKVPLDGEGWMGHGRFHECAGIWRRSLPRAGGVEWKQMRYLVFDAPGDARAPFVERMAHAERLVAECHYAQAVQQVTLPSNDILPALLAEIEKRGGEGLIVRDPVSAYECTRSPYMLKITTREQCEVRVIGYECDEDGGTGALRILLPSGVEAKVGSGLTVAQRKSPPPIGSTVTISYKGLQESGKPREPVYVGRRNYE